MEFQIVKCIGDEADFIGEKLVEYNLRQVMAMKCSGCWKIALRAIVATI